MVVYRACRGVAASYCHAWTLTIRVCTVRCVSRRDVVAEPVAAVFARSARRLRVDAGLKAEQVAKAVTARGLPWANSRVAELEMGRIPPTLPTLLILSGAYGDLLRRPVTLTEWFGGGNELVALTEQLQVPVTTLVDALSGKPVALPMPKVPSTEQLMAEYIQSRGAPEPLPPGRQRKLWAIYNDYGEADDRAAVALGIDKGRMVELMVDTWGCSLTARRDKLAGKDSSAQKRGQITRQLREELRKALDGDSR